MVLPSVFVTSDTQVDVFGVDLIEEGENGVAPDDLAVEVIGLKGF